MLLTVRELFRYHKTDISEKGFILGKPSEGSA